MKVDISALLGGDIYAALRERSQHASSRASRKERDDQRALEERKSCLAKLQATLDIPAEVMNALPTAGRDPRQGRSGAARAQARTPGRGAGMRQTAAAPRPRRPHADRHRSAAAVEVRLELRLQGHALGRALQEAPSPSGEYFPPFLYISIINSCNLRCQGCWVDVDGAAQKMIRPTSSIG